MTASLPPEIASAKVAEAADMSTRRMIQSVSAPSLLPPKGGARSRPDRVKVDLRRQSPLVALFKQIQAEVAAGSAAQSASLGDLSHAASHERLSTNWPTCAPPSPLDIMREQIRSETRGCCTSLGACASSHSSSTLGLARSPDRAAPRTQPHFLIDPDGGSHALAGLSIPTERNALGGCAGFRPLQPLGGPARTLGVQWRHEKLQNELEQKALQGSVWGECRKLEKFREEILSKPRPALADGVAQFAAKRAGSNPNTNHKQGRAAERPSEVANQFRRSGEIDSCLLMLVLPSLLDTKPSTDKR